MMGRMTKCLCGCGGIVKEENKFIANHHNRRKDFHTRGKIKRLCACGCGEEFNKFDNIGRERFYLVGHGRKGKGKFIQQFIKCKCGCGKEFKELDNKGRKRLYFKSHHNKGLQRTDKQKINYQLSKRGKLNPNFGKHHSSEARKKLSLAHSGDNNPNWKGGLSLELYGLDFNKRFKKAIRERDNHTCQSCKKHKSEFKINLAVHHIDYIKTNNFTFNCISLCNNCHTLTNHNRDYWITFFQNYMQDKYGYVYHITQTKLKQWR